MTLRYTPRARDDLAEIHEFIAQRNPAAARNVVSLIRKAAESLIQNPEIGRSRRVSGTRELAVVRHPFIIVYRTAAGEVQVLSVIHTASEWPKDFDPR